MTRLLRWIHRWEREARRRRRREGHGIGLGRREVELSRRANAGDAIVFFGAVPWDYRFQRPQQLSRALAREGTTVFYVEAFSRAWSQPRLLTEQLEERLFLVQLRLEGRPDPYRQELRHFQDAAARLLRALPRPRALVVQLPFWLPLVEALRQHWGAPLVYDRIDRYAAFPGVPAVVVTRDREAARRADVVTASSAELLEEVASVAGRCELVHNAVALDDFPFAPGPVAARSGAVEIGYVGALSDWFDVEALTLAARTRRDLRFVLAGRVESRSVRSLGALSNVVLLGEIPYERVPGFLAGVSASLLTFRDSPLTRAVDPVKLYESLAVGRAVVGRDLPELRRWQAPCVYRYDAPERLVTAIERCLAEDGEESRRHRREAASVHTWKQRARELLEILASVEPRERSSSDVVARG